MARVSAPRNQFTGSLWLIDVKLRFAVKDIIDVAGLETGLGNRSYRRLYPARISSAPCIDRLIAGGADLVGKAKTTQFAEGEVPTQWYEFLTQIPTFFSLSDVNALQRSISQKDDRQILTP